MTKLRGAMMLLDWVLTILEFTIIHHLSLLHGATRINHKSILEELIKKYVSSAHYNSLHSVCPLPRTRSRLLSKNIDTSPLLSRRLMVS